MTETTATETELQRLCREFIDGGCAEVDPDISDLRGLIEDTGGTGLCKEVSVAFIAWLSRHRIGARAVYFDLHASSWVPAGLPEAYPRPAERTGHWVVVSMGYWIDFTARQFSESLGFPEVWTVASGATYTVWVGSRVKNNRDGVQQ